MRSINAISTIEPISGNQLAPDCDPGDYVSTLQNAVGQWESAARQVGDHTDFGVQTTSLGIFDPERHNQQVEGDILACFVLDPGDNKLIIPMTHAITKRRVSYAVVFSMIDDETPKLMNNPGPSMASVAEHLNMAANTLPTEASASGLVLSTPHQRTRIPPIELHSIREFWDSEDTEHRVRDILQNAAQRKQELQSLN